MASGAVHRQKCSKEWQLAQWRQWPTDAHWPGVMDLYEAAAFKRVHPMTVRRACQPDKNGRAELAHERIGPIYRLRKMSLLLWGAVEARSRADARWP